MGVAVGRSGLEDLIGRPRKSGTLTVTRFEEKPTVGGDVSFEVTVENDGIVPWDPSTHLSLRWRALDQPGQPILKESQAIPISPLAPKVTERVRGSMPVPINSVMDVIVDFELRDANGAWLGQSLLWRVARALGFLKTPSKVSLVRRIIGQHARNAPPDFEYADAYRATDLETDWWTIVGPGTREEYELLGRNKLKSLRENGLTPDAKILDVGCGTGQLTEPLVTFLGDNGLYYGTDVVEQAVDFCKRKFKRANFHFVRNDHTAIPIQGIAFDVIFLGSVFTHMFPNDIHDMLEHLRRLLAPRGCVIADAFVSPTIESHVGSRAMIQLNEAKLLKSFEDRGFRHSELSSIRWNEDCRRVVYKLREA